MEKKEKYYDDLVKLGYINTDEFEKLKEIKEQSQKALANESGINVQQQEYILDQILIPIYQLIEKVNFEMKKFDNINRFALDDYNTFTNKKKDIDEKIEDLSEKEKKILDVLKVLNEKKENTINITFQKLNTSFRSFFKELIPYGDSSLELSLENQTIHININMTDSEIPINSIYQLSGGQKTAVGISLVFALSHIESPPFYVLDEIDSALDSNIRLNFYKLRLRIVQRDLGRYPFENNHACWDWFPNGYENNKKNEKKDNIYLEEIKCLTNKQKTIIQNLEKIDNNNITKMNNLIKELYRNEAIAKIEYLKKEIDNIEEKIERHEQYKLRYRR